MEVYLIRHTTPDVEKGICYGQTDLDITDSFLSEAAFIKAVLPAQIDHIYCSPLQRCTKLAAQLFPCQPVTVQNSLMEINCGDWEMLRWNDIPKEAVDPWLADFINIRTPNGENYQDLFNRVVNEFSEIITRPLPAAIVAHGGVIRSILAHITGTPMLEAFNVFKLHYGCVVKIETINGQLQYTVLSNIPQEKETHRPDRNIY